MNMITADDMRILTRRSIVEVDGDVNAVCEQLESEIRSAAFQGLFWVHIEHEVINSDPRKTAKQVCIISTFTARLVDSGYQVRLKNNGFIIDWHANKEAE